MDNILAAYLYVEKEVVNGELFVLQTPQLNMQSHLSFIWRADSGENPLRDCIITEARRLSRNRQMKK